MINIIKQEITFDLSLKQKLEFICEFLYTTPTFINGYIHKMTKTNLSYIEPHKIIIKGITFLAFNYSNEIYIKNLSQKIKISELEDKVSRLEKSLDYFKELWQKFIQFLQDKFSSTDKYDDIVDELYEEEILDSDDLDTIKNEYSKDDDLER